MKKLLLVLLLMFSCKNFDTQNIPKIAIIGLGIESSTFSPAKTVEDDFLKLLENLNNIFEKRKFLFGNRPSIADIGFSGPFFRHFALDPVPLEIIRQ